MSARDKRKKETVQRILDAARRVFAEIGYEGARVDHIAELAAVNKAMIYYHIGDKQALYSRVLHDVFGDMAGRLGGSIKQAGTPVDKIKAYVRGIGQTVVDNPCLPRIMMREIAGGGRNLQQIIAHDFVAIIGLIGDAMAQGCAEGVFNEVDPFVLHMMIIGGIEFHLASQPVRSKHGSLMAATPHITQRAGLELISEVEKIVLNALVRK